MSVIMKGANLKAGSLNGNELKEIWLDGRKIWPIFDGIDKNVGIADAVTVGINTVRDCYFYGFHMNSGDDDNRTFATTIVLPKTGNTYDIIAFYDFTPGTYATQDIKVTIGFDPVGLGIASSTVGDHLSIEYININNITLELKADSVQNCHIDVTFDNTLLSNEQNTSVTPIPIKLKVDNNVIATFNVYYNLKSKASDNI